MNAPDETRVDNTKKFKDVKINWVQMTPNVNICNIFLMTAV